MYKYLIVATAFGIAVLIGCGTREESMFEKEIWKSIEHEDLESIRRYANSRGNLNASQMAYPQNNLLIHAMKNDSFEAFRLLLKLGSDPNAQSRRGQTAMHVSVLKKHSKWLEALLSSGGEPNLMNSTHKSIRGTPLGNACGTSDPTDGNSARNPYALEMVKILVENGADVNLQCSDYFGEETPVALAAAKHNFDVVLYLLERGAQYGEYKETLSTGLIYWMGNFSPATFHDLETRNQYLKVREFIERDARSRDDKDVLGLLYQMQRHKEK